MNATEDLLSSLYSSADPLCVLAAQQIESKKIIVEQDQDIESLVGACKLMMEALMEIYRISMSRDSIPKAEAVMLLKELNLRLKECGSIANDTLSLQTVQSVFRGYYY